MSYQMPEVGDFQIRNAIVFDENTVIATVVLPDGTEIHMTPVKIDLAEVLASAEDYISQAPHEEKQA